MNPAKQNVTPGKNGFYHVFKLRFRRDQPRFPPRKSSRDSHSNNQRFIIGRVSDSFNISSTEPFQNIMHLLQ